jgi:ribosomal protein L29
MNPDTMASVAKPSSEDLFRALQELETPELDRLTERLFALRAQRTIPHLDERETDLLQKINQGLPEETARRYHDLMARRRGGKLSVEEHEELLGLTAQAEDLQAERIEYLTELARLRRTPLRALMEELGL